MLNNRVQIWGQSHSALSHFYYPSDSKTYRLVINSALSGKGLCVELSNEFAVEDVRVGGITVAKSDENGAFTEKPVAVTVMGKTAFCLKKGETVKSDISDISVNMGEYISISIFVEKGSLKSGNLLNNASLITVKGDKTYESVVENQRRKRDTVRECAAGIVKMCLHKPIPLIQSVSIECDSEAASIIVFGDSLCQQGLWTNNFEKRIRKEYPGRYSIINKSIMGNRILRNFSPRFPCKGLFGPSGINRLERDVLNYPDCRYVILALGTNDFLQYGTIAAPKGDKPSAEQVFDGVKEISCRLSERGIKTIVFNVLNFGECIDSRHEKEDMVHKYNKLLEDNRDKFFYVYDQASICVNKNKPTCTDKKYLGKDFLHLNEEGGKVIADNLDLSLFL